MKPEDKELLLTDLCGRLPHGVYVQVVDRVGFTHTWELNPEVIQKMWTYKSIKPYLRPMSSMTEEEQKEFVKFHCVNICPIVITEKLTISNETKMFEWLNAHHFDYRGLIEKGLAIEVTKDNNPYKN